MGRRERRAMGDVEPQHHPSTVEGQIQALGNVARWVNRARRSTGRQRIVANVVRFGLVVLLLVLVLSVL